MKIAIGPYGGGSGISTYTSELCKALATIRNDLDITLLTWQGIDYPDAKFPTLTLPKNTFLGMSDFTGGPFAKVLGATPQVSMIRTESADIVFTFGSRDLSIKGKGAQLAIDAFTKLLLRDKTRAVLFMVGGKKDALSVPNAVRDSVIFTGFLDRRDYLRLLGPGRCFLALSHGEELDYACLEAMAAGCAVIVSPIPAHYMVRDHETGRVVSRNADSIQSAMLELTDDDTRLQLGKNAAKEVKQLTSPDEIAKKYSTIYQRVLST